MGKESINIEDAINIDSIEMRPATKKEQDSIDKYILSIAKDTGINFYDYIR